MRIDQTDPRAGQLVMINEMQDFPLAGRGRLRKRFKQREEDRPVVQLSTGWFSHSQWMACDPCFAQERPQTPIPCAEERDPYWGIDKDHGYGFSGRRVGTGSRLFSVPSSFASLLLLSRAIRASTASLTRAVFCLMPVNVDARFNRTSSIFSVVLICNNTHKSHM